MTAVSATTSAIEFPFLLAGANCGLRTNSEAIAEVFRAWTRPAYGGISCEFNIEVNRGDESPLCPPHFRGRHHIVVASFGAANVFVFDLRHRVVTAKVSAAAARDSEFWGRTLLPIAAGVLGPAIGTLPVHSACLSRRGSGMLVAGESGAGKSTLAVALAQRGFDYVSDDWTYCTLSEGVLTAHGTAARVKLLPDAALHFPALAGCKIGISMNGEAAFEVPADMTFGATLKGDCTPRMLLFLHRSAGADISFTPLDRSAAQSYLEGNVERLPPQLSEAAVTRAALIEAVAALPCWRLECSGGPASIAQQVDAFFAQCASRWE